MSSDEMTTDELVEAIRYHRRVYYQGNPEITDAEFDAMVDEMERRDPESPVLSEVGAPPEENAKYHKIPMYSLAKSSDLDNFARWYHSLPEGTPLVSQLKYDGCSVSGEYESGQPVRYLTRGDGITGEDYTDNLLRCHNPEILDLKDFTGSIRGEAVIHRDLFTPENFPHPDDPTTTESNRRNSVAGSIKKENSRRVKFVDLIFYDVVSEKHRFRTEQEKVAFLQLMGLPTAPTTVITSLDAAIKFYHSVLETREDFPYMIDGLVFKVDDLELQEQLGLSSNRPKGQRALKFPALYGTSTLRGVEFRVGHTGRITLRAHYDQVTIDNRNFAHATLNNFEYIQRKDIHIGDEVTIEIGGDIIPKIVSVHKPGDQRQPILPPETCPECGGQVAQQGACHFCINEDCSGKSIRKIRQWITKTGIKYFGPAAQNQCFEAGIVKTPVDLYTISEEALGNLIGPGNARNVKTEVNHHRQLPLHIFMGALGIPYLGRRNAQTLVEQGVDTLEKFRNLDSSESYHGFGETLVSIRRDIDKLAPVIDGLLEAGVRVVEVEPASGNLEGKKFVVTGTLSQPRNHFKGLIESNGGTFQSSVNQSTDYLLAGEGGGSKRQKAERLGVPVISEVDFLAMIG